MLQAERRLFTLGENMLQVSTTVHPGASSPFADPAIVGFPGLTISPKQQYQRQQQQIRSARKQQRQQLQKQQQQSPQNVYKCNGQLDVRSSAAHQLLYNAIAQKMRSSPSKSQSSKIYNTTKTATASGASANNISNNTTPKRGSPLFKEVSSNSKACDASSDGGSSDSEGCFAGSKFCVTPSPSELPAPPLTWMAQRNQITKQQQDVSHAAARAKLSPQIPQDLTIDSAVLAVGTSRSKHA